MLIVLFVFFVLFSQPCAGQNFSLNQQLTYNIQTNGDVATEQELILTNNTNQYYIEEYQFRLPGENLKNISAHDDYGQIIKTIDKQNEYTDIVLKFNRPPLGKDKILKFSLSYLQPDFCQKKGSTWEIYIPIIPKKPYTQTNLSLVVPLSMGSLAFSSLPIANQVSTNNSQIYNFSSEELNDHQILLVFGNYQLFDFKLYYQLNNPSADIVQTEIAIPPQTENQQVVFRQINPKPSKVDIDKDGNWLAQYLLNPNQTILINVDGQAKILPSQRKTKLLNPQIYLNDQKYWPVTDPKIQELAIIYPQPEKIYNYVVSTLDYDYSRANLPQRKGAKLALSNPSQSLCTEFTDLFISIARAAKIPSREIEGYAYTNNNKLKPINETGDILHAWPQYYDPTNEEWKSIDPTWGKTTNGIDYFNDLDLNHLTFVIHGISSNYPSVPGSYKENLDTKTVYVDTAKIAIKPSYLPLIIEAQKPKIFFAPLQITISNPNPNLIENIDISSDTLDIKSTNRELAPYSNYILEIEPISFWKSILPQNQKIQITQNFNNLQTKANTKIYYYPHYQNLIILSLGLILLLSLGGILVTTPKTNKK